MPSAQFDSSPSDPVAGFAADPGFEAHLDNFATNLVRHAVSLREDQPLFIQASLIHRHLAYRVGDAAYAAGAGRVRYLWVDPLETTQLVRRAQPEQIVLHHVELRGQLDEILRTRGALIMLDGRSDPQLLTSLGRSHPRGQQVFTGERFMISQDFQRRVIEQRLCPTVIAVCPTTVWARRVFPELPEEEAFHRLWELIFQFTFTDRDDGLERAAALTRQLETRAAALSASKIRAVHVTGGGNDLRLGFSEQSRWSDGSFYTADGQRFFFNVPSFEVYTTPDRRLTEGRLVIPRPVCLPCGATVDGLVLDVRAGRVVEFAARHGAEAFGRWLDVDEGARYLGEFALVGQDSPIARSGLIFEHRLLDENAAAHVALGSGISAALDGGDAMSPDELEASGCNRSDIHIDLPFGSAEVDVVATGSREGDVVLLERGLWAERFAGDGQVVP